MTAGQNECLEFSDVKDHFHVPEGHSSAPSCMSDETNAFRAASSNMHLASSHQFGIQVSFPFIWDWLIYCLHSNKWCCCCPPIVHQTPSENEFREKQIHSLPWCDGTNCGAVVPPETQTDCCNLKGFYTIILQSVLDHRLHFWNRNVGWQERCMLHSCVYQSEQNNNISEHFDWLDMPGVLLGHAAHACGCTLSNETTCSKNKPCSGCLW